MKTVYQYPDGTVIRLDQRLVDAEFLVMASELYDRHGGYPVWAWEDGADHPPIDQNYEFYGDHKL